MMMARAPQSPPQARETAPKGHGAKSDAVRQKAILALLSEPTIDRAAKHAGINEWTLRRWLSEDEAFKAQYDLVRQSTFQAAMSRIHGLTARAVDTLEELLGEKKHPSVRLGAARTIAEIGMHQYRRGNHLEEAGRNRSRSAESEVLTMKSAALQTVRSRIDPLVQHIEDDRRATCSQQHWQGKVSHVFDGEPDPVWPILGAPQACWCGQALEYRHVIHRYMP